MLILKFLFGLFQALALILVIMLTSFHRKNRNASTIIYFLISSAVIMALSCFHETRAHGNGAPKSRCDTMIPGHWVNAQTSLSPYQILVDKTVISPGDRVNITLKAIPGQTGFKGFFVMVKEVNDNDEDGNGNSGKKVDTSKSNYGVFDLTSSDMSQAQPVPCFDQRNSAMTHVVNYVKDHVELYWIAPKLISEEDERKNKNGTPYMEKELKIVSTFVKDFWTYWVDVEPVGDVRLLLTDTYRQVSPKFIPVPPVSSLPSSLPEFRGIVPVGTTVQMTPPPSQEDSNPLDANSSWNHFRRAWNYMVDLFVSSTAASSLRSL